MDLLLICTLWIFTNTKASAQTTASGHVQRLGDSEESHASNIGHYHSSGVVLQKVPLIHRRPKIGINTCLSYCYF